MTCPASPAADTPPLKPGDANECFCILNTLFTLRQQPVWLGEGEEVAVIFTLAFCPGSLLPASPSGSCWTRVWQGGARALSTRAATLSQALSIGFISPPPVWSSSLLGAGEGRVLWSAQGVPCMVLRMGGGGGEGLSCPPCPKPAGIHAAKELVSTAAWA